jgi:hypothetical protein
MRCSRKQPQKPKWIVNVDLGETPTYGLCSDGWQIAVKDVALLREAKKRLKQAVSRITTKIHRLARPKR